MRPDYSVPLCTEYPAGISLAESVIAVPAPQKLRAQSSVTILTAGLRALSA
jgi:hypothetical protein